MVEEVEGFGADLHIQTFAQINGIFSAETGLPLAIGTGGNNVGIGNPGQRPNNNGTSAKKTGPIDQRLNSYFDQSVFSVVGNWTFGIKCDFRRISVRRARSIRPGPHRVWR